MALPEIESLLEQGRNAEGIEQLSALAARVSDAGTLAEAGQLFTFLNLHTQAEQCFARAVRSQPANAGLLYNWATSQIALGQLEAAEVTLSRVLNLNPADYDAYYNRATLRCQSPARNHVAELQAALSRPPGNPAGAVALCYALAKELEDLGQYRESFAALRRGADARRRLLSYDVADDERTMARIAECFGATYLAGAGGGCEDPRPIFIVGLPRSGTTLIDRILSSHSQVSSRGESNELARALLREVGEQVPKAELIERATRVDARAVGERYCRSLGAESTLRVIDKNPVNFLYLGVIARALPQARVIHLRRDPMDLCYAIYKTLFRMAYPYSYEQQDLGRYYLAYHRLMAHWRALLPAQRLFEVGYEELIAAQEPVTRRLLDFCGLPWEAACLAFDRNESPVLTASAAQVRQPLYSSSIGQWRRYRNELEPLARALRDSGIDIEARARTGTAG